MPYLNHRVGNFTKESIAYKAIEEVFVSVMGEHIDGKRDKEILLATHTFADYLSEEIIYTTLGSEHAFVIVFGARNSREPIKKQKTIFKELYKSENIYDCGREGDLKVSNVATYFTNNSNCLNIHLDLFPTIDNMVNFKSYWSDKINQGEDRDKIYEMRIKHDALIFKQILIRVKRSILRKMGLIEPSFDEVVEEAIKCELKEKEHRIQSLKSKITSEETNIKYASEDLRRHIKSKNRYALELVALEKETINVDRIKNELEMIKNDKKVQSVTFATTNGNIAIQIKTIPLIMRDSSAGIEKYLGEAFIKIPINGTLNIELNTDQKRKGYWSQEDPHPHVGKGGQNICFGNVSEILASLSADKEYYAIMTICINFLETFNKEDYAGKNYIYYPDVEYIDGIPSPVEVDLEDIKSLECDSCGSMISEDERNLVYETLEDYANGYSQRICDDCVGSNYHYDEMLEAYIHDDVGEIVRDVNGDFQERVDSIEVYETLRDYRRGDTAYVHEGDLHEYDYIRIDDFIILDGEDVAVCHVSKELYYSSEGEIFVIDEHGEVFVSDDYIEEFKEENGIED